MTTRARPWILGIGASHNGGACLLHGDEIVVATQEERLVGDKHHRIFGAQQSLSIDYCLRAAGIDARQLDLVVLSAQGPAASPRNDIHLNPRLQVDLHGVPSAAISHHLAHAVSAYALSGWSESAILVVDRHGSPFDDLSEDERRVVDPVPHADWEDVSRFPRNGWETVSMYEARGTSVRPIWKALVNDATLVGIRNPAGPGMSRFRSAGGMYAAAAAQIFADPMQSGKVMGLAPYGRARFATDDFFAVADGRLAFKDTVPRAFPHDERWPASQELYRDLAKSVQEALEAALLHLVGDLAGRTTSRRLCYAGGVALNCVANERIIRESDFDACYIVPAAEDSGTALGSAYWGLYQLTGCHLPRRRRTDSMGTKYTRAEVDAAIAAVPLVERLSPCGDYLEETVGRLCNGQIVGWFQGGAELGPRSLGNRSILCDPRRGDAKDVLNARVKRREAFRPFAPSILLEHAADWFELGSTDHASPFMLRVAPLAPEARTRVPAVTHVDGTGRLQTVTREDNGPFHALIERFHAMTDVPLVVNTSFNTMGEPIVETPEDALWCLASTDIDACVLGDTIVVKGSSFESLLDLHPRNVASQWQLSAGISNGRANIEEIGAADLRLRVRSRWGEFEVSIDSTAWWLLELMDGTRSGWRILEEADVEIGADELLETLAHWRRLSVIELLPGT